MNLLWCYVLNAFLFDVQCLLLMSDIDCDVFSMVVVVTVEIIVVDCTDILWLVVLISGERNSTFYKFMWGETKLAGRYLLSGC